MHQSMGAPSVVAEFWEGPARRGTGRPPFVSPLPLARADRGALFLRAGSASPAGSDVGRVFYTHPQAMTAEGAGVLRRMRCRMTDVEVLHAGRVHPDGDPLAHYRDQLQRLISAASRDGVILFVGPDQTAQAVRRPEAAV